MRCCIYVDLRSRRLFNRVVLLLPMWPATIQYQAATDRFMNVSSALGAIDLDISKTSALLFRKKEWKVRRMVILSLRSNNGSPLFPNGGSCLTISRRWMSSAIQRCSQISVQLANGCASTVMQGPFGRSRRAIYQGMAVYGIVPMPLPTFCHSILYLAGAG